MKSFAKGSRINPTWVEIHEILRSIIFERDKSPSRFVIYLKILCEIIFQNCQALPMMRASNLRGINLNMPGLKRWRGALHPPRINRGDYHRDMVKVLALYFARQQNRARFITGWIQATVSIPGATEVDTYVIGQPACYRHNTCALAEFVSLTLDSARCNLITRRRKLECRRRRPGWNMSMNLSQPPGPDIYSRCKSEFDFSPGVLIYSPW